MEVCRKLWHGKEPPSGMGVEKTVSGAQASSLWEHPYSTGLFGAVFPALASCL